MRGAVGRPHDAVFRPHDALAVGVCIGPLPWPFESDRSRSAGGSSVSIWSQEPDDVVAAILAGIGDRAAELFGRLKINRSIFIVLVGCGGEVRDDPNTFTSVTPAGPADQTTVDAMLDGAPHTWVGEAEGYGYSTQGISTYGVSLLARDNEGWTLVIQMNDARAGRYACGDLDTFIDLTDAFGADGRWTSNGTWYRSVDCTITLDGTLRHVGDHALGIIGSDLERNAGTRGPDRHSLRTGVVDFTLVRALN